MLLLEINNLCVSYFSQNFSKTNPNLKNYEREVIKNFTANVYNADRVAIIGSNGSGKSTLLKTISGHIKPSRGNIKIYSKIKSQLSLSSGVNLNITGRDNFYLKCAYKGISKSQSEALLNFLAPKVSMQSYIDDPVHTYSSGMRAKLLTTFLAIPGGKILVLDEWVGTADLSRTDTSNFFTETLFDSTQCVIFTSHSPKIINKWATKVWVLNDGELVYEGDPELGIKFLKQIEN